jgi:ribosome-binding ATPase YchF (GTP1/OBG family)
LGRLQVRSAGLCKPQGRDYVVQDGDIIVFKHN